MKKEIDMKVILLKIKKMVLGKCFIMIIQDMKEIL